MPSPCPSLPPPPPPPPCPSYAFSQRFENFTMKRNVEDMTIQIPCDFNEQKPPFEAMQQQQQFNHYLQAFQPPQQNPLQIQYGFPQLSSALAPQPMYQQSTLSPMAMPHSPTYGYSSPDLSPSTSESSNSCMSSPAGFNQNLFGFPQPQQNMFSTSPGAHYPTQNHQIPIAGLSAPSSPVFDPDFPLLRTVYVGQSRSYSCIDCF